MNSVTSALNLCWNLTKSRRKTKSKHVSSLGTYVLVFWCISWLVQTQLKSSKHAVSKIDADNPGSKLYVADAGVTFSRNLPSTSANEAPETQPHAVHSYAWHAQSRHGGAGLDAASTATSQLRIGPVSETVVNFFRDGFLGPIDMFTHEEMVDTFGDIADYPGGCGFAPIYPASTDNNASERAAGQMPWPKGCFKSNKLMWELANHPKILKTIEELLGDTFFLWGSQLLVRGDAVHHRWHTDIETASCKRSASVWIGVENTNAETGLKVVKHSHHLGIVAQALMDPMGAFISDLELFNNLGQTLHSYALKTIQTAEIVEPDARPGQAIIFQGGVWHGTANPSGKLREAILLQYSAPECGIPFPISYAPPFRYHDYLLPVALVRGNYSSLSVADQLRNNYFQPYSNETYPGALVHASYVLALQRIEIAKQNEMDATYHFTNFVHSPVTKSIFANPSFHCSTKIMASFEFHTSNQVQYMAPQSPHAHEDEEICYIHSGILRFVLLETPTAVPWSTDVNADGIVFVPRNMYHSLIAVSKGSTSYTCIRYTSQFAADKLRGYIKQNTPHFSDTNGSAISVLPRPKGQFLLQQTYGVKKLEGGVENLTPGGGVDTDVRVYDMFIFVEAGQLLYTPSKQTLTAGSQVFVAAGALHGLKNIGNTTSRHIEFKFYPY